MHAFLQDIRQAVRQLRKSPGFSLTALATLALGIGAVTSVFSVVHAVLLNPFAFRNPDQLVIVRETVQEIESTGHVVPVNYLHYERLRAGTKTLEDAAIFQDFGASVAIDADHPHILGGLKVAPSFFSILGVQPILGRAFTPEEATDGHNQVVMLSYETWQRLFHGDVAVLGHTLRVGGEPQTIIGVLPASFRFPSVALGPDFPANADKGGGARTYEIFNPFVPYAWDKSNDIFNYDYSVLARLKPGVTLAQARAELDGLQKAHTLTAHLPVHLGIAIQPFAQDITGGVSTALWLLFAAVGAVLLIACVNLANLQLARAVSRERETAVRSALGASKARLLQSRFAESLVLAVFGGAAGTFLAELGVRLFVTVAPANIPRIQEVHVDWPVLLFAAGLSVITAILFGTLPALRSLRVQPQQAMQNTTARAANPREGAATRNLLVAAEVACTIVLLIVAALVIRSFAHVLNQARGFDSSHVTVAQVDLFSPPYGQSQPNFRGAQIAFIERALDSLRQIPGVQSVAMTSVMPLTGDYWVDGIVRPDHPLPPAQEPKVNIRWVSPDYFSVMQVPVIAGRSLTSADKDHPDRAVISQAAARAAWPGEDPIGKQFNDPTGQAKITVVGVVADTRTNGLKQVASMVYLPFWNFPPWQVSFLVRSSLPTATLAPAMRREIWNVDPEVAIPALKSMDAQISDSVALERFQTLLLASFGVAALLLALLGIYGVLSYSMQLREQEMGIRIALGADRSNLVRLVMRQAAYPVAGGLFAGLALAMLATRAVESLLYQTKPADPLAMLASCTLLLLTAFLAVLIPALRAANADPARMLRAE